MNDDILSILEYKMPSFSKGQKRIAALICESYDKTAFMTASALGKQAGVSESTVVRFAMELGYEGYPEMQKAMQELVMNRLTSVQRMGMTQERIGAQDVVSSVLHSDAEKIRQTADILNRNEFAKSVEMILNAKKVYIIGVRSVSALAEFLGHYLGYMLDNVHTVTDGSAGEILEKLVDAGPGDAVIAFSFPRYTLSAVDAVAFCRNAGTGVIGITNSSVSPLAAYCDCLLTAKSDMVSIVDSLTAPLSVVNALIVALAAAKGDALRDKMQKLEAIWQSHHIYDKKDDVQ